MITTKMPKKRMVPLAATFAALYGMLKLIPISLWIGPGARVFTASEFLSPVLGIVLGPYAGSLAATVGTFLGIALTGRMNFFGLDFLPATVSALVLGFLVLRKPIVSFLLYSTILALFFIHPSTLHFVAVPLWIGTVEVPFVWLHLVVWVLLMSPLSRKSVDWIAGSSYSRAACAASLLTLIGTTAQQLTGTLLFASMAGPLMGVTPHALAAMWIAVFYIYPVERLVIVIGSTVVTLAVVRALRRAKPFHLNGQM
jgi:hypothetical protein